MRTPLLLLVPLTLLLASCSGTTTIGRENRNPLTAARYGDELADLMANLIITNDPVVQKEGMREIIEQQIAEGKKLGDEARTTITEGLAGPIINHYGDMVGFALYADNIVYFSSDFATRPGPSVRVYLTTVVDPRDVEFPDPTAVDLGPLQSAYGPQQYGVRRQEVPDRLRTLVFYDAKLGLLYGFAQLSRQAN